MLEALLKRILRRKVEDKVEKVVSDAVDAAFDPKKTQATQTAQAAAQAAQSPYAAPAEASGNEWDTDYNHDIAYFRDIIRAEFPDYYVAENVPFATVVPGVNRSYPPYTFVFSKNNSIALVISLQSKYSYQKGLHTYCERNAKLHHINFFIEYPDHRDYVVDRIRKNLAF